MRLRGIHHITGMTDDLDAAHQRLLAGLGVDAEDHGRLAAEALRAEVRGVGRAAEDVADDQLPVRCESI